MKILINNISIEELITNYRCYDCNNLLISLAQSLKIIQLSNHSSEIILTGNFNSFLDIELVKGINFRHHIRNCPDREARGIILARLSSYTKIEDISTETIPFSLSLFTKDHWKEILTPLNTTSPHISEIKNIPCFSSGEMLKIVGRASILQYLGIKKTDHLVNPDYSEIYYNAEFERNYTELMRTNSAEKTSLIKALSELLCLLNGFIKNNQISKMNNRDIYYNADKKVYLSVDFLHGTFEIHNNDGIHQFEINCKGTKLEQGDKSGRHNIRI